MNESSTTGWLAFIAGILLVGLLTGCANSDEICAKRGFQPGTENYLQCTNVQDALQTQKNLAAAQSLNGLGQTLIIANPNVTVYNR